MESLFAVFLSQIVVLLRFLHSLTLSPEYPISLIAFVHGLRVSLEYRRQLRQTGIYGQPYAWLQGLFATCAMSLGGTTISGSN